MKPKFKAPQLKLLVFLLLLCHGAAAQQTKIGSLLFSQLNSENKPAATLFSVLHVFENNSQQRGRKIPLYIEVLPATDSGKKQDPLFILMGGPGQAATDLVAFFADIMAPVNRHSDIVFIDQRGTGRSHPLKLSMNYLSLQDYFNDEFLNDTLIRGQHERMARQSDLRCYGTLNAAIDLETVRRAMGYGRIHIYGTSYGSRLALTYMKMHPANVHTATLKGIVPDKLVIPYRFAADAQKSLDYLVADCASIDSCRVAFPGLETEIRKLFASVLPAKTSLLNPQTQKNETVEISNASAAITLRVLLLSPASAVTIPFLVTEANKGNFTPLANSIIAVKKSYITGLYDGMSLCVTCFEDYPLLIKLPAPDRDKSFLSDYWINRIKIPCKIWNPDGRLARQPKLTLMKTPVLLISSERDPATPPAYGEEVLKYFPNGKHIIISQASHSFNGMTDCVENIICDFMLRGTTRNIRADCIHSIRFPAYKLK